MASLEDIARETGFGINKDDALFCKLGAFRHASKAAGVSRNVEYGLLGSLKITRQSTASKIIEIIGFLDGQALPDFFDNVNASETKSPDIKPYVTRDGAVRVGDNLDIPIDWWTEAFKGGSKLQMLTAAPEEKLQDLMKVVGYYIRNKPDDVIVNIYPYVLQLLSTHEAGSLLLSIATRNDASIHKDSRHAEPMDRLLGCYLLAYAKSGVFAKLPEKPARAGTQTGLLYQVSGLRHEEIFKLGLELVAGKKAADVLQDISQL